MSDKTHLGNSFGIFKPDVNIISKIAKLEGYLAADNFKFDLIGQDSRLTVDGAVLGTNIDGSNLEGSFEHNGNTKADKDLVLVQKNEDGEFINKSTLEGENVTTIIKGDADIKDGQRFAAKALTEALPNSLDFSTETGEISASNIKTQANLTVEGIYRYLDIICLLYTSPSPRDKRQSRMPSSA